MKRNLPFRFTLLLAGTLILTTCHKEYFETDKLSDEIELESNLVAPLIYGEVSMSDIVERFDSVDYVDQFPDSLIYIVYSDTIISVTAEDATDLPDWKTAEYYLESDTDIPQWLPVGVGDTFDQLSTRTKIVNVEMEGDNRIDHILVKGGSILIELTSTFKHAGWLTISSEQILDNLGDPFTRTLYIDDSTGYFEDSVRIPSDNFRIIPLMRNDTNIIYMDFDLVLINSGNPISPGEQCVVRATFDDLGFYEIFGFLDTRDLATVNDSLDIPLWSDNPDLRSLTFADPRLEIISISSLGIPFEVELDSVIAQNEEGAQVILTLENNNTLEFLAPGLDQIGESVTTHIEINKSTSNINDFLAVAPSRVYYDIEGRTTTTGEDTTHFILDDSELKMCLEFLLPLDFKSTGFALVDTLDFEVSEDGIDTSMIKNLEVTVSTTNELPIELAVQVLLLDSVYTPIDSVFEDQVPILGASTVDVNGKTVTPAEETNIVKLPASKLGKLKKAAFLQVEARLITSEEGERFVKLYSFYSLQFNISLKALLKINTREL